jgi:hypothetical protein
MLNVNIPIKQESETSVQLEGDLTVPTSITNNANGIVIFAHGSGSSHHSPRNHNVAQLLNSFTWWQTGFSLSARNSDKSIQPYTFNCRWE